MDAQEFIAAHEGDSYMTRTVSVTVIETRDGYIMARAESKYGTYYAAARNTEQAIGEATAEAIYGSGSNHLAKTTAEDALDLARWLNTLGAC